MQKLPCLIILFVLLDSKASSQTNQCDTIYWTEERTLSWSDFRGLPDSTSSYKAVSVPGIGFKAQNRDDTLIVDSYCRFYTCKSWKKSTSTNLLRHEQTHFDIAEYFRRLFIDKLTKTNFSKGNAFAEVKRISEEINKLRDDFDEKYDLATNFSINKVEQEKWSREVRAQLQKRSAKAQLVVYLRD